MTSQGSRPCAGFNVSCGTREECEVGCSVSWKEPKISPKPNPAQVVSVSEPNRSRMWDVQFTHYSGGIGGTCGIYDPPFSFWCSSPPFSAGCGGCFTWNIPGGIDAPASMLQDYDKEKLVSNGASPSQAYAVLLSCGPAACSMILNGGIRRPYRCVACGSLGELAFRDR